MSHFKVFVIGRDPEAQLAPYHEFECTARDDKYVVAVDITRQIRKDMMKGKSLLEALEYHALGGRVVTNEAFLKRDSTHQYGYAIVTNDGALVKAVQRTNPNAKWDWYELGGRYSNTLKLKGSDTWVDQAEKKDIDFEGIRAKAVAEARARYKRFHALADPHPPALTWEAVRAKHPDDIEAAREEYHA